MKPAEVSAVVTVETSSAHAEALSDWMRGVFGVEPVSIEKPNNPRVWIELYFAEDLQARLAAGVLQGRREIYGLTVRAISPRDWQDFWRHHFSVTRVGRLRLIPLWEQRHMRPLRGITDIVINPGLSFGTGTHFTTRYCLEALDRLCRGKRTPASLLDLGTGSGILSIAAAKLGVRHITATENDAQALDQARKNARHNAVARRIRFTISDIITAPPLPAHDVVVANLFGHLLIRCAASIAAPVARDLVLSGIRETEADAVAAAFTAQGCEEVERDGDGEWCGMRLIRPPAPV